MNLSTAWGLFQGLLVSIQSRLMRKLHLKTSDVRYLPRPMGCYNVGCLDVMTKCSPEGVFLRLFYPTDCHQLSITPEVKWLPHIQYVNGLANFTHIWPFMFRFLYKMVVDDVYSGVSWKAKLLKSVSETGWPLVIFSHGLGGCRTMYSTFCMEIASHGFVVAAVEHRDRTACATMYVSEDRSEQWIPYRRFNTEDRQYPLRNAQVNQRATECVKALNLMISINNGDDVVNDLESDVNFALFKGQLDINKVAIMGHSFGGATIIPTLSQDTRFKLGVGLDTWMFPVRLEEPNDVRQPLRFVNMEKFQTEPNVSAIKRFLRDGVSRDVVTLIGGVHQNVTDVHFISDNSKINSFFSSNSTVKPELAMQLICASALQFTWKELGLKANEDYLKKLDDFSHLLNAESLDIKSKY